MKLYGADVCPFVHRARLTLAEKGLEHEYVAIDLRNKPDWYNEVLPTGKVPLLEHNGHRIWESDIVCEYLEEAFPEKQLLPSDPGLKATARIWIEWVSSGLIPPFYKLLMAQEDDARAEHKETMLKALEKLETEGFQDSEWIFGDSLSLVDIETYPWFERWPVLVHYRALEVPDRFEKIHKWMGLMKKREQVKAIAMDIPFYVEQYAHYAMPKAQAETS
jgi:glutathione S-transferase